MKIYYECKLLSRWVWGREEYHWFIFWLLTFEVIPVIEPSLTLQGLNWQHLKNSCNTLIDHLPSLLNRESMVMGKFCYYFIMGVWLGIDSSVSLFATHFPSVNSYVDNFCGFVKFEVSLLFGFLRMIASVNQSVCHVLGLSLDIHLVC